MWFLVLAVAAVSRANGAAGKLNPVRLSAGSDHVDNRSDPLKTAETAYDEWGHPAATAIGSLTCMRWTGGSCAIFACKGDRRSICEDGYCMCGPGACADAEGKCNPSSQGKWIGEYSIKFTKPFSPERPFLGIASDTSGYIEAGKYSVGALAAVSTSNKQWKIAQTPNGRVRLTNTRHPGSVLMIYNSRRRSPKHLFLQQKARRQQKKIADYNDLWPMLMKLEAVTPLQATFQIRPTLQNGGGYELWDPENQVSLASADPDAGGLFNEPDHVSKKGVTECDWQQGGGWSSNPCDGGKQLVAFEPALPAGAVVGVHRSHIVAMEIFFGWQVVLLLCCVTCFVGCCTLCVDPRHPADSAIFEVIKDFRGFADDYKRGELDWGELNLTTAEVEAKREAEALERKAFAERIAGFWVLEADHDMGNFEYKFLTTSKGISVNGRKLGALIAWGPTFAGQLRTTYWQLRNNNANVYTAVDQLFWEDDSGTQFTLTFKCMHASRLCDRVTEFKDETCSGMAMATSGLEVLFTGKRTSQANPATTEIQ